MKNLFAKLMGISSSLLNFYLPIFRELFTSGLAALLPIALDIVREVGASDKSSSEKRNFALGRLRDEAQRIGVNASESLLRYTIESAVQRLKLTE
jgi:hypothetical protein